jgi:hypothetical protein
MKRILFMLALGLLALFGLAVALNAPRLAEARAHEAAARAMQTQAVVTGLAVSGLLLVVVLLVVLLAAVALLILWGMATGRLVVNNQLISQPPPVSVLPRRSRYPLALPDRRPAADPPLLTDQPLLTGQPYPYAWLPANDARPADLPADALDDFDWRVWENNPWDLNDSA